MGKNDMTRGRLGLNWEDLHYFLALADQGTLSGAARILNVTHVTISRRVKRLEDNINAPLFDQKPRGFELTDTGNRIYECVAAMAAQATTAHDFLEGRALAGVVRLSATPSLCEWIAATGLPSFHKMHPNIKLEILSEGRNVSLARHEAHLALRLARPETGKFVIRRIGKMDYGLYRSSCESDVNLAVAPVIGFTEEYDNLPEARWLQEEFPNNSVVLRSNSLNCQKLAIEKGIGVGLLPIYLARNSESLYRIRPNNAVPSRGIWMAMRETLKNVPRIRIVAESLVGMFTEWRSAFEDET